jgi:RNA polymerase sigma factor (sigma-70 family)
MDMASTPLSPVLRYIRKIVDVPESTVTDGQLLDRFVRHRNEAAFSALVERHGPMVMGICRRVLCNSHDAEDAFQATFLVLVRRSKDIARPGLLANWLYGVAYRTAAKAKADVLRRRTREAQAASNHQANAPGDQDLWNDVRPILDEEINLLPVKYRTPVVLCYLQGKTNEEAARQQGNCGHTTGPGAGTPTLSIDSPRHGSFDSCNGDNSFTSHILRDPTGNPGEWYCSNRSPGRSKPRSDGRRYCRSYRGSC